MKTLRLHRSLRFAIHFVYGIPRRFLWANSYHDRFRVNICESQVGVGGSHERYMAWNGRLLYLNNEKYSKVLWRCLGERCIVW